METTPAQFFTHVGFTAPRLCSAHPPRRPLLLSLLPGHSVFQAGGYDQGECTITVPSRFWRRKIRPPPPPGGRSKKDLVAGAGKGWEHSSVPWSQEQWCDFKGGSLHLGTTSVFYILWHLIIRMSSSALSLTTWVRVWRQKVLGICYCCWKKLTCSSFLVTNGFYWITVLSFFSLARLNWQCLKYYSVPEFGNFKKKNPFPFPKWIVSQCGFWTARLGTRVAKQSKECMFTNRPSWGRAAHGEEVSQCVDEDSADWGMSPVGFLSLLSVKTAV